MPLHAGVLDEPSRLNLDSVVVAINFGTTTDQKQTGVTFRATTAKWVD